MRLSKASASRRASRPRSHARQQSDQSTAVDRKHFVIDTNVVLHDPECFFLFADNEVVVPMVVLEELDNLKRNNDEIGRNARAAIRTLDELRDRGRLVDGIEWNGHGGTIRVALDDEEFCPHLRRDRNDDRVINTAWRIQEQGRRTVFVSKDINARIRADAIGLTAEDFESQKVNADLLYTGVEELTVPGAIIDELYTERQIVMDRLEEYLPKQERTPSPRERRRQTGEQEKPFGPLYANQFVILHDMGDDSHTGLGRRLADTNHVIPVAPPRKPVYGILARNARQVMALDLLLDDDVQLVTLIGPAGTGKTLLAVAAGMHKVFNEKRYDKLLVARPIMPMGRDIGYLPGDKDEKLTAWMQPIFDNLAFLLSSRGAHMNAAESQSTEQRIKRLVFEGSLVLEALTYIRGRSIPNQFMIVDEAQNLTPHEVKTIVSRVGEGTKLVLTGDLAQIDNPYLDAESNGLAYLIDRFKEQGIVGHMKLTRSERSNLASIAANLL